MTYQLTAEHLGKPGDSKAFSDSFDFTVLYPNVGSNTHEMNLPALFDRADRTDYVDAEWDEAVPHADRLDYILAGSCGVLSGAISVIWNKIPSLSDLRHDGSEKANGFVLSVAKAFGYKGKDLEGAIRFLENKFPLAADKLTPDWGGGLQHHLRDFAHHPTPVGLICSLIGQFTGMSIGTDTSGIIKILPLPEDAPIGKNFPEKVFLGTVQWALHLVSDMAGSSLTPGKGTGIPGPILSFLKEMSALPIFKAQTIDYKDKEISVSQLISKLFNGTFFRDDEGNPIRFDLRSEMGIGSYLAKQAIPVIINECLVRSVYTLRQLFNEIKKLEINTFSDLLKIEPAHIMPCRSRVLTRMCTVSSAVFVSVNAAGTAAKVVKEGKATTPFSFLLYVNVVGIGRLVFACAADAEYIKEDIRHAYEEFTIRQAEARYRAYMAQKACAESCSFLKLNDHQNRLLLSLRYQTTKADIEHTRSAKERKLKNEWLLEWSHSVTEAFNEQRDCCFIEAEENLYRELRAEAEATPDLSWFFILLLELSQFAPYAPISSETINKYKNLKTAYDYFDERFVKSQTLMPTKRIVALKKAFDSNKDVLTRGAQNRLIAAGSTAAVTIAAAVGCCIFAPGLAALLVGHSFVGIHGIALTNASLALLGGGSLAVGGLGMAGGTAVLTGGGALVGLIGSGTISATTLLANTSSSFVLAECTKMLTICKYSIAGLYGKDDLAISILRLMENRVDEIKTDLLTDKALIADKDKVKQLDDCVKYLERSCSEIKKALAN